jgi:phage baseplate assembly protein W
MAFDLRRIQPIDTRPSTAVGISLNNNSPAVFTSTYTTADAIKANLINYLLTDVGARYLNTNFGGSLMPLVFQQMTEGTYDAAKLILKDKIQTYFPNVTVRNIQVFSEGADINTLFVNITYEIINTGISDTIQLTLG